MLAALSASLGASPLLLRRDPSDFALDFGVDVAAVPPRKPFGWDAYWGAADTHAGPSHSFARQRRALQEQKLSPKAKPTPTPAKAPLPKQPCDDKGYSALGTLVVVETCRPLANCCSMSVPVAYGRRWTAECVEGVALVEYCPLGTPFGNVGWRADEGWCGKDHSTGAVCTSCTCCCPDAPPSACIRKPVNASQRREVAVATPVEPMDQIAPATTPWQQQQGGAARSGAAKSGCDGLAC